MKVTYIIKLKALDLYVSNFTMTDDVVLVTNLDNARQSIDKQEAINFKNNLKGAEGYEVWEAHTETTLIEAVAEE